MRLDFDKCQRVGTTKHDVPNGGTAVLDSDDKLVAYRRKSEDKGWDWVRKGFQFVAKKQK
jgi:hypothetical protein